MFRSRGFIFRKTVVLPGIVEFVYMQGTSNLVGGRLLIPLHINKLYNSCTQNRLPEDELAASKHLTKGKVHLCTGTEALYRSYGP